jgi:hypothetical protein
VTKIPEELPTSPLSLMCPICSAKPGQDCARYPDETAIMHIERIEAAALLLDEKN